MRRLFKVCCTALITAFSLATVTGCASGDDAFAAPRRDLKDLAWSVNLNHRAATMAIGDVIQLETRTVTAYGEPVSGLPDPIYTVSPDTLTFGITPTGLLTARRAVASGRVIVTQRVPQDSATLVDTILIRVTATPVEVKSFSIRRPDSLKIGAGSSLSLAPLVISSEDDTIAANLVTLRYSVDNLTLGTINASGSFTGRRPGSVTAYAYGYLYGQPVLDSITLNVTRAVEGSIRITPVDYFSATSPINDIDGDVTILRGGSVRWTNASQFFTFDIYFKDPTNVDGGDIPSLPPPNGTSIIRGFPVVGTYEWYSKAYPNIGGRIIVIDPD